MLHKGDFDVCCTTYEMLTADTHGMSARFQWGYVVLDEAHRAKNERSNLGQAVRKLKCNSRLLITGTPLQNRCAITPCFTTRRREIGRGSPTYF